MSNLGPNTAANVNLLQPKIILCGGEDPAELSRCLAQLFSPAVAFFEYRCYRFWKFADQTVIWTGIGTGCLEPLLWELIRPGIIEQIILVGTAGHLPNSKASLAVPHVIDRAWSGGTSLDDALDNRPAVPRFSCPANLPTATITSTDYYYGFSSACLTGDYRAGGPTLQKAVAKYLETCDLVDMETAQFYHFCEAFDRTGNLKFVSIKGSANDVVNPAEQLENSEKTILNCLRLAAGL